MNWNCLKTGKTHLRLLVLRYRELSWTTNVPSVHIVTGHIVTVVLKTESHCLPLDRTLRWVLSTLNSADFTGPDREIILSHCYKNRESCLSPDWYTVTWAKIILSKLELLLECTFGLRYPETGNWAGRQNVPNVTQYLTHNTERLTVSMSLFSLPSWLDWEI